MKMATIAPSWQPHFQGRGLCAPESTSSRLASRQEVKLLRLLVLGVSPRVVAGAGMAGKCSEWWLCCCGRSGLGRFRLKDIILLSILRRVLGEMASPSESILTGLSQKRYLQPRILHSSRTSAEILHQGQENERLRELVSKCGWKPIWLKIIQYFHMLTQIAFSMWNFHWVINCIPLKDNK